MSDTMEKLREVTCAACKRRVPAVAHCKSRTCQWFTCPVCGASFDVGGRWNQPPEFAGSLAAATVWARRHGIKTRFVEVGKK